MEMMHKLLLGLTLFWMVMGLAMFQWGIRVGQASAAEPVATPDLPELIEQKLRPDVFRIERRGNVLYVRYRVKDYVVTVQETR